MRMNAGSDEPTATMTPEKAIWALLLLLPLDTKFLFRNVGKCSKWLPITKVLKAKYIDSLSKHVSNDDFESLLHATFWLNKVNEVTGQESFFAKKFESTLQAVGMRVIVQSEQVRVGNKRSRVKTILIKSVEIDTKNNDSSSDQWNYDSRSTIRSAKKCYNSAKRCATADSAENERNIRSRTVAESSLSDSCSSTAESSPATTDNDEAAIASTREQRERTSISNDSTALLIQVHDSMDVDDFMPLPNPQSWADRTIEDANKFDFSLNPRPEQNGGAQEIPLLNCAILDDKYCALLAFWISCAPK